MTVVGSAIRQTVCLFDSYFVFLSGGEGLIWAWAKAQEYLVDAGEETQVQNLDFILFFGLIHNQNLNF